MSEETKDQTTEESKAAGTAEDPIYLTNMSIRALGCKPAAVDKTSILIARIWGLASEVKSGEDRRTGNPWTALAGEFAGINLQAGLEDCGKTYRSGKLFLPAGIQEVVEKAVSEMKRDANAAGSVRFALELYSAPANNASKYTYQAKNILKVEAVDPISEMAKQLAAPVTDTKHIAPPEETKKKK